MSFVSRTRRNFNLRIVPPGISSTTQETPHSPTVNVSTIFNSLADKGRFCLAGSPAAQNGCGESCPSWTGVAIGLAVVLLVGTVAASVYIWWLHDKVKSLEQIEIGDAVRNPATRLLKPDTKCTDVCELKATNDSDQLGAAQSGPPVYLQFADSQAAQPIYDNDEDLPDSPGAQFMGNDGTGQPYNNAHGYYVNVNRNKTPV